MWILFFLLLIGKNTFLLLVCYLKILQINVYDWHDNINFYTRKEEKWDYQTDTAEIVKLSGNRRRPYAATASLRAGASMTEDEINHLTVFRKCDEKEEAPETKPTDKPVPRGDTTK